jgi:hypothetical protein
MALFDPEDLQRLPSTLGHLAAVAMGGLVVTGVPLTFVYEPDGGGWLSAVHALSSALLIGSAVALVALVAWAWLRRLPMWVGGGLALAGFAVAAAGVLTGQGLRWTGLEPPDDGARGLVGPLGGDVDTVLVGSGELSRAGFLTWALVHVVAVTAAVLALAVWFRRRRDRAETPTADTRPPA